MIIHHVFGLMRRKRRRKYTHFGNKSKLLLNMYIHLSLHFLSKTFHIGLRIDLTTIKIYERIRFTKGLYVSRSNHILQWLQSRVLGYALFRQQMASHNKNNTYAGKSSARLEFVILCSFCITIPLFSLFVIIQVLSGCPKISRNKISCTFQLRKPISHYSNKPSSGTREKAVALVSQQPLFCTYKKMCM